MCRSDSTLSGIGGAGAEGLDARAAPKRAKAPRRDDRPAGNRAGYVPCAASSRLSASAISRAMSSASNQSERPSSA